MNDNSDLSDEELLRKLLKPILKERLRRRLRKRMELEKTKAKILPFKKSAKNFLDPPA